MNKFVNTSLVLLSLFVVSNVSIAQDNGTENSVNVEQVIVRGNKKIDTAAIKLQIKKTKGEFSQTEISDYIKSLYQTGYFDQVTASIENVTSQSGVTSEALVFSVVEKPVARKVYIKGNEEVKEGDLADVLDLGTNRFIDKNKLESLTKAGVIYYQSRGYYDATMDYTIVSVGENQVDVTFKVKEGDRYKIKRIEFKGLKNLDQSDLRTAIETKRYKWWNSWLFGTGRLNKELLEQDKTSLRQFFLDRGYVDASISEPVVKKEDNSILISFTVNEGLEYKVGKISVEGDLINNSSNDTISGVEVKRGDIFNATKVREDTFVIGEKFSNLGYAFVNVVPDTSVNKQQGIIDLNYKVSKGKKVTVDKIIIKGNSKTYDKVIRREMRIAEQDLYSSKKIKRSQDLLRRLGFFEEVSIVPEPAKSDDRVNLIVTTKEASTGTFSVGAGYSTSDGVIGNARISENNLFGTGRKFDIDLEAGDQRNSFQVSLEDPRINDTYLSGGIDAYKSRRFFEDFDRDLTGGNVSFGYPLEELFGEPLEDIKVSLLYEYLNVDIKNVDNEENDRAAELVINSEGKSKASGFIPQINRNTIDNPLNPTKGSRQIVSYEITGVGGDEDYTLFEFRNQWYYPFLNTKVGQFVFSWRTKIGIGESNTDKPFPLFRRYFPGGIDSVRGYEARTMGPREGRPVDQEDAKFGGAKQLINNFELIFPLVNSAGLRGVVFYDAGEAFDDEDSINIGDLRKAHGFGVRWSSPIGPVRLEFGFPEDKLKDDKSMQTLFSFGAPL